MDSVEYYDEKLTIIKAFNTYLNNIIDKGYNNDIDILLSIVKHINNFTDEQVELNNKSIFLKPLLCPLMEPLDDIDMMRNDDDNDFYSCTAYDNDNKMGKKFDYSLSDSEDDSDKTKNETESETDSETDSEDEEEYNKKKNLDKIQKFINSDDLSKIYFYKKHYKNISKMRKFINDSLRY